MRQLFLLYAQRHLNLRKSAWEVGLVTGQCHDTSGSLSGCLGALPASTGDAVRPPVFWSWLGARVDQVARFFF